MNLWNKKENKGKMFLNYSLHVQRLLPFRQMHILKNIKYFCLIKKIRGIQTFEILHIFLISEDEKMWC